MDKKEQDRQELKISLQYLSKEQLIELLVTFMTLDISTNITMLDSYQKAIIAVRDAMGNAVSLAIAKLSKK